MSRTRIVKGTYTKITNEEHNMYSQESIITKAKKWISELGIEKGVSHGTPQSPPLTPQPIKLIVHFRPNKDWKGEFGFDWVRQADTKLFNDKKFKDIVAYQYLDSKYTKKLDKSDPNFVNKYDGSFKADETMFNTLKKEYKPYTIPWKTKKDKKTGKDIAEEYYIPWMSIIKDKEVKITFYAEIVEEADYLEFTKSDYFTFTPKKIDIKGKKKVSLNDIEVTIKCVKEFTTDQTIELKAFKTAESITLEAIAGKLNVWANDASKHKKKDVVFIEIKTPPISSKKEEKPKIIDEKDRINQYLQQAYIQLSDSSVIVELDLTTDKKFSDFVTNNEIDSGKKSGGNKLQDYLKMKLEDAFPKKFSKHFKAFYFAENGYNKNGGNTSGYSSSHADFVVVFKSKNDQTAAHEFLHSMNLPHTFTNKDSSGNALYTYEYSKTDNLLDYSHHGGNDNKRCSLFYWQWKQANNSIK